MKRFVDMHLHSKFSVDSDEALDAICKAAIAKGLSGICITDHVDYNPKDIGYGYYKQEAYQTEIAQVQEMFKNDLLILSGVEFSEPHLYKDELMKFQDSGYDVILGSIHWLEHEFVGQKELLDHHPQQEVEALYYEMILKSIEHGGFDVLAHLDFPKRYYGSTAIDDEVIVGVLKHLVKHDIALEINTSSLRKGLRESMPAISMVEAYIRLGGRKLTLGSDAHLVEDIASHFHEITSQLSETATNSIGIFKSRKFMRL